MKRILCFFIIFVSVSEPKKDKLSEIAEGVQGKFGAVSYETPFLGVARALQTMVENRRLYKDVSVQSGRTHLDMELASNRFFKSGSADLDEETAPLLAELVAALKQPEISAFNIIVESHTDDAPPQSGLLKNNWELSSVRAAKIVSYLIAQGFAPNKIKAVGYGDSRPKVPNLDAHGNPIELNRLRNQRVVVRIESM